MATKFRQGYYTPKNLDKYIGDPTKVIYRSSWELQMHQFFDNNTRVIKWGSEVICIPYVKPTDGKVHRYYPDYFVEYINTDGEIVREVLELKPQAQTRPPKANHKHKLYEQLTYAVNCSKWEAAEQWCIKNGVKWRIFTETNVFR